MTKARRLTREYGLALDMRERDRLALELVRLYARRSLVAVWAASALLVVNIALVVVTW